MRTMKGKIAALLVAGAAAVTLAPSASAAPLPNFSVGLQLSDGGCRTEFGTPGFTRFANFGGTSATPWVSDTTRFDPDCARIFLNPAFGGGLLRGDIDFRIGGRARDNNGRELGAIVYTPWASDGGGNTEGMITDSNSFDPDEYQLFLETRPLPPGAGFTDFRFMIFARDAGEGDGEAKFTPWASQNGGPSPYAPDRNLFDPDGYVIGLEVV
ncbi:hypothetical protein [Amycolatopsis sp. BJA-103]|uniref:hypothetical protein n=1 Tax=Amycolatopsis sp. BJA-103 TaxID=1911175 RepID=UPI000C77F9A9|nr:hypothetical protein [Amycolatopsis sp. BJA-103]AUI60209.1 hypothetical protein BKN51_19735 [Amycolatopsis sp. BJA-103]PNE13581.1 hypothetical protein B1H26_39675 [Amycolatopsis sp. BJA-103]